MTEDHATDIYRKKLLLSTIIPGILVFIIWLVKVVEVLFGLDLTRGGIFPLDPAGLPGILFSPFIHDDFRHLFNNTLPLFFLSVFLFYFYSDQALKILGLSWLLTGLFVWLAGREAWHIGASGLVYGLASFLFFSGIIRKYFRLIALSLLIVFLYGSMVWGIFPDPNKDISWEAHMLGFFSGIILTIAFRNEGPQPPVYEWMEDEESERNGEGESGGREDGEKSDKGAQS